MTPPLDLRPHFSRFAEAQPERIHLAAHSHHYWPDVTFAAQARCWEDAALHADEKWEPIFTGVIPAVQRHIARILHLPDPGTIAIAPNTHDFLRRLLSALPANRAPRILSTDGEFHTFTQQMARLEEDGLVTVERIAVEPAASFPERFRDACARGGHDLVFTSQVFFNSGATSGPLESLADAVRDRDTLIVIDGYHGFMAFPTDLARVADRIFYVAGGYKYAMSGEGCCFMHCPPGYAPRPRDTGWYASFGTLSVKQTGVRYSEDGMRFVGATFDPSGFYRMRAVFDWMEEQRLTVAAIHDHVLALQERFLAALHRVASLRDARVVTPLDTAQRGHFLTFALPDAAALHKRLMEQRIVTDVRGDRIRFGFGCYHVPHDIDRAVERMAPHAA